jgi:pyrroline-5-carboxylate reductase
MAFSSGKDISMISAAKIAFIGGGNMAEAMLKGLLKGALPAAAMLVAEPIEKRRRLLVERYGVKATDDNNEAVRFGQMVVLAIKPQLKDEVLSGIAASLGGERLLISILAGVATDTLEGYFDGRPRVVRAMPNMPALVGEGATAICAGRHALPDDLQMARRLFETVGNVQLVDEKQMDAVTGLSGSGPAYIFTVIEALTDGGVQQGLPRETAMALAVQTVLGAARLMRETGSHPAVLRDQICSPGGTSIAGIKSLEDRGLRAALMDAVASATRRSRELGEKK